MKIYFNHRLEKKQLKKLLFWFHQRYGYCKTRDLADTLKTMGFHYATYAGISLGVDDLQIPPLKTQLLRNAHKEVLQSDVLYQRGEITSIERFQKVIEAWSWTSENVKEEVLHYFKYYQSLNPIYMMAFSGARGNISQVRQLVGMRGLMSDPQGNLIDVPIKNNFREGLSIIEYLISCYGARKGIVDTALKTANSGYLTRRLVEAAQSVTIYNTDCKTHQGIFISNLYDEEGKALSSLEERLTGRVLMETLYIYTRKHKACRIPGYVHNNRSEQNTLAHRNEDVKPSQAKALSKYYTQVQIRSPLTCSSANSKVCQLCYGWDLSQSEIVSLGEAVGTIAAQSIGEPGTQLTMRTFHTGGVFSGDVTQKVVAPSNGYLYISYLCGTKIRTQLGQNAFFSYTSFYIALKCGYTITIYKFPSQTLLFVPPGQYIEQKQIIAEVPQKSYPDMEAHASHYFDTHEDHNEVEVLSDFSGQVYLQSQHEKLTMDTANALNSVERRKQKRKWKTTQGCNLWILCAQKSYLNTSFVRGDKIATGNTLHTGTKLSANAVQTSEIRTSFLRINQNIHPRWYCDYSYTTPQYVQYKGKHALHTWGGYTNTQIKQSTIGKHKYEDKCERSEKVQGGKDFTYLLLNNTIEKEFDIAPTQYQCCNAFTIGTLLRKGSVVTAQVWNFGRTSTQVSIPDYSYTYTASRCPSASAAQPKTQYTQHTGKVPDTSLITELQCKLHESNVHITIKTREVKPYLLSKGATSKLQQWQMVDSCDHLFNLPYNKEKTGDIVQGLPKIEQLFEARKQFYHNPKSLSVKNFFFFRKKGLSAFISSFLAIRNVQNLCVHCIQRVYQSQGISLSDKHVEIIVRRMTSYVLMLHPANTSFLPGEIVQYQLLQTHTFTNTIFIPYIVGITKVSLSNYRTSFLSAASFQETRRILMNSALEGCIDYLDELKQPVILGKTIPAGIAFFYEGV